MHHLLPRNINNNCSPPLGGRLIQREDGAGAYLSWELRGEEGEGVGQATAEAKHCEGIEKIPAK